MRPDVFSVWCRGRRVLGDYFIFFACHLLITSAAIMGDECDWTGSGLTVPSSGRGVTPVYLRCTAGKVTWLYPRGALRVLLRLPGQDREFRACVQMRTDGEGNVPARLFLEGPRSLLPLYSYEDGGGNRVSRCFTSKNGQAAIYVEATDGDSVKRRVAGFVYDLQPLPRGVKAYDPAEECRPCTSEELAHTFCTSDLVTRGIIRGVENRDDLEITQLSIKVTKMIRDTSLEEDLDSNSIYNGDQEEVVLHVSRHCKVTHGLGEFVFMARRKLGDLTLQCAPRLEEWAVMMHSLTEEGRAHCMLRS